ncbi:MAG: iron ABC transporter permease [Candidatus Rokuibacteriota bacterium]|nr:MAG: iron ABC transporter permease [Candidatus Rokubacteria bacterium]
MGRGLRRSALIWSILGSLGFLVLPWYALPDGLFGLGWPARMLAERDLAPAVLQAVKFGRPWLLVPGLVLMVALVATGLAPRVFGRSLVLLGAAGFLYTLAQGFAIGLSGWSWPFLERLFGALDDRQLGLGGGALVVLASFLFLFATGLAARGYFRSDAFVAGAVVLVAVLVGLFTFFPVVRILMSAAQADGGALSMSALLGRLGTAKVWRLDCLGGGRQCGVAWNTLALALLTATTTTGLGLAFALVATRTGFRAKRVLRLLTVLPIITPPFVIGLGLILIFGRAGFVNQLMEWAFAVPPSRWIYGLPGVWLAQTFAFTPVAFLVLIGVVEGVSPSLEEASQTLRAGRWETFRRVSLPLMRPGLANAFLIGFIESIADFGNPIVLGGNFGVLSTEIFFSIVGAQLDQGRAAALGLILLAFALGVFLLQRRLVGRRLYISISGKGDAGQPAPLPTSVRRLALGIALPWALLTLLIYLMALAGGFVETWGRNYTPTLRHYAKAFSIERGPAGLIWSGAAWNSLWTTLELASIAAPLTAGIGLLTAWLLVRQRFSGRSALELATMLSFAIPGTVIGVSYILAFNVPPIELTGTGIILVLCFVFRNLPVGVRAGMAAMSQIDPSLDEASRTLGGRSFATLRRVILPLLRPAVVAALVYSFVRAMTTVSAVIFLVSAEYDMATTYIINRVINGDYGVAIAYCSVLILLMLAAIGIIQWLVGTRRMGRRAVAPATPVVIGRVA